MSEATIKPIQNLQTIRRPTTYDIARLLFVGALWGASFIFMSLALGSFGPLSITAWRVTLAALVLLAFTVLSGQTIPHSIADWKKMFLIGVFNSALPFFLISWGLQFISSAESAVLMATGTFCALILSHFFSPDERINLARGLGVAIGFCGVLVLVISELMESGLGGFKGQLAVMAAGASYATSSVMSRRISHLPSMAASGCIMLSASLYMLPMAFFLEQPLNPEAEPIAITSLILLGVFATALAFAIRLTIIRHNGAVFMSQVGYLVPLFGVIWSWMFLSEALTVQTLAALGIILLGISITRRGI